MNSLSFHHSFLPELTDMLKNGTSGLLARGRHLGSSWAIFRWENMLAQRKLVVCPSPNCALSWNPAPSLPSSHSSAALLLQGAFQGRAQFPLLIHLTIVSSCEGLGDPVRHACQAHSELGRACSTRSGNPATFTRPASPGVSAGGWGQGSRERTQGSRPEKQSLGQLACCTLGSHVDRPQWLHDGDGSASPHQQHPVNFLFVAIELFLRTWKFVESLCCLWICT